MAPNSAVMLAMVKRTSVEKPRTLSPAVVKSAPARVSSARSGVTCTRSSGLFQATFEVPFPHPRRLTSPEAQALKESILGELGL